MYSLKKKKLHYLYIFFIILTFNFIEFSTNKLTAKTFNVYEIEVEEIYNLNFNKLKVIDRGFRKAFDNLSRMILEEKDFKVISNIPIEDIKKLVDNFSILDEKFIDKKYKNKMEVQFNRSKLINFFYSKNITISLPKKIEVFFLPIFVDLENNNINYLNNNIFVKNWKSIEKNYFQINYILPNEDVEDFIIIKENLKNIEDYNFSEIIKKYNLENYIIMVVLKKNKNIKFYSKVNLDNKLVVFNKNYIGKNIDNQSDLSSMIVNIKNKYEDNWKSINKINPSNSVPIRLSLEANKIKKSLKLENALINLDYVNNYRIDKFDSLEIIYKINYSSTPKRFLNDIIAYDIIVDTSSVNWKIK